MSKARVAAVAAQHRESPMKPLSRLLARGLRLSLSLVLVAAVAPVAAAGGGAEPSGRRARVEEPVRDRQAWRSTSAVSDDADHVDGEILVRFEPGSGTVARAFAHARVGAKRTRSFRVVPGLELVELPRGTSVAKGLASYRGMSSVEYAQPNYRKTIAATTPDDPRFGQLWGLNNTGQNGGTPGADISALAAWDITTGSRDVIVAVLDTGVDYTHPDLAANMWVNPGEIPGNGIDDDGNGHVDDVYGIDTVDHTSDPFDDNGHGTHCAGTVGAVGDNGLGVSGVNWNVSVMAVKMLDARGSGTTASAIAAFEYASAMGAGIISNSWGGHYPFDQAEYDAIAAIDALFVCAAGNENENNDVPASHPHPYYPASYDLDNIIAVGASNASDARASFSSYGATTVDVFAPGMGILSTIPGVAERFVPDVARTIFSEDFTSVSAWDLSWHEGRPWTRSTAAYTSAPSSLAHLGYRNNDDAYADSPPIDCSLAGTVLFDAKVRYDLETRGDYLDLWVTSEQDEGMWHLADSKTGSSGGEFEEWRVDIGRWAAGKSAVQVSFGIDADESLDSTNGYEGVYVDDVRLVTIAEGSTYFSENFTSLGAWTASSMYAYKPWTLSTSRFVSGPSSVSRREYVNNERSRLVQTPGVDMTGADAALLRFKAWHDLQFGHDWTTAYAGSTGIGLKPLVEFTGRSNGWRSYTGIMTRPGAGVSAVLEFESDGSVSSAQGYEGVYIDDLEWIGLSGTWVPSDHSDAYASWNGTSMATPHVSGIAALLLSIAPGTDTQTLKSAIMDSAEQRPALAGLCVTGARVNAHAALLEFASATPPVTTATGVPAGWSNVPVTVRLDVPDADTSVTTRYRVFPLDGAAGAWTSVQPPVDVAFTQDGEWRVEYRSQDAFGNVESVRTATVSIDRVKPLTSTTADGKTFAGGATVTLSQSDALSGVASTHWSLDGGATWNTGTSVAAKTKGAHTLRFYSVDNAGNVENQKTVTFTVTTAYTGIAGDDRILTAVAASKAAFPQSADTVVIATAYNWPDALGGTALAGVLGGPILLSNRTSLPSATAAEIQRLKAKHAIIVGGEAALDPKVESALATALGSGGTVDRISGDDRYQTADKIALAVIAEAKKASGYSGTAFVATGADFPDALAAAPLAAGRGWPLFLVHPTRGVLPGTKTAMAAVSDVIVLGGTGAVSGPVESGLRASPGVKNVERLKGDDRWETAVAVAEWAVDNAGFSWDRVALTNGRDFPDALAGGVVQGERESVMLLTAPTSLSSAARSALRTNRAPILRATFLGGPAALSADVRAAVIGVLE